MIQQPSGKVPRDQYIEEILKEVEDVIAPEGLDDVRKKLDALDDVRLTFLWSNRVLWKTRLIQSAAPHSGSTSSPIGSGSPSSSASSPIGSGSPHFTSSSPLSGYRQPSGSGGCFIAAAAYGSDMAAEVEVLRELRDRYIMKHRLGRALVSSYYRYGPGLASYIDRHKSLRVVLRTVLRPIVGLSRLITQR